MTIPQIPTPTPITIRTLFDFTDSERVKGWANQDDPVMGGRSASSAGVTPGALLFSGTVSLQNNGGFASIQGRTPVALRDLSAFNAVRTRVRGDGKTYIFSLWSVSDPRLVYWQRFKTVAGEWIEITLPFRAFEPQFRGFTPRNAAPLDVRSITACGFYIADKQSGPFRLEIANITAVVARPE